VYRKAKKYVTLCQFASLKSEKKRKYQKLIILIMMSKIFQLDRKNHF